MPRESKTQIYAIGAFAVGTAASMIVGFGELIYRTYLHVTIPVLCIVGLVFPRRRMVMIVLVALMLVFTGAYLPAGYSLEGVYGQVLTTELTGAQFFADKVDPPVSSLFYAFGSQLIVYYNVDLLTRISITNSGQIYKEYVHWTSEGVNLDSPSALLNNITYFIFSIQTASDPIVKWQDWLKTEPGRMTDVIYDNGYFTIYDNSLRDYLARMSASQNE